MEKLPLNIETLKKEALDFCTEESSKHHSKLYGVTDGKAIGTYIEHLFKARLKSKYEISLGNVSSGIDLPDHHINTDIKTTSANRPQSSSPFRNAKQKIFGLGYNLLIFVYQKKDYEDGTSDLIFTNCSFVEDYRTGDYTLTKRLIEMKKDGANREDIIGYLEDRNVPGDDLVYASLADEILAREIHQGYLTISNALQWRLKYSRILALDNEVEGVTNYESKY